MRNILVLGAGQIGKYAGLNMAKEDPDVAITIADIREEALKEVKVLQQCIAPRATVRLVQLTENNTTLNELLPEHELVISAVPGNIGYDTLKQIILARRHAVDFAFFPENPMTLDKLAKARGVIAVTDMGLAPGVSHAMLQYGRNTMDSAHSAEILCGGLPKHPKPHWYYKAPFAATSVIDLYTRPARVLEDGEVVSYPPLAHMEPRNLPRVKTPLAAFKTDGLRTLLQTTDIPNINEYTLRDERHYHRMHNLAVSGAFDPDRREATLAELEPAWKLDPDEPEFTVLQVNVHGSQGARKAHFTGDLYCERDPDTGVSSMAITTGGTAAATARMILDGRLTMQGVIPPEYLGTDASVFLSLMEDLRKQGVSYNEHVCIESAFV